MSVGRYLVAMMVHKKVHIKIRRRPATNGQIDGRGDAVLGRRRPGELHAENSTMPAARGEPSVRMPARTVRKGGAASCRDDMFLFVFRFNAVRRRITSCAPTTGSEPPPRKEADLPCRRGETGIALAIQRIEQPIARGREDFQVALIAGMTVDGQLDQYATEQRGVLEGPAGFHDAYGGAGVVRLAAQLHRNPADDELAVRTHRVEACACMLIMTGIDDIGIDEPPEMFGELAHQPIAHGGSDGRGFVEDVVV
ncbi:hypothetical protein WS70_19710 [Burkholderia mayonis]|uniref:Uncharacterized protein n=1 Tax=Burkholderia mayonis TaxID=1385591 RepID=A0A1B4FKE3_9BURK|nr:hypothetical protein WS70_19710 [Burkholderia mayonis]KVE46127.1 hypothetical protein WS70_03040 [Burkholderia mayonis]